MRTRNSIRGFGRPLVRTSEAVIEVEKWGIERFRYFLGLFVLGFGWGLDGGLMPPPMVCSGIAKNAKNACAKSLGTVHDVYNEGEPSVGLFV